MEQASETKIRKRRHWFRFSLRTLLIFMALLSIGLALIVRPIHRMVERQHAVVRLQEAGVSVSCQSGGIQTILGDFSLTWLGEHFGDVSFFNVELIALPPEVDHSLIRLLALFPETQGLMVTTAEFSDADLKYILPMRDLEMVDFIGAPITDEGVAQLAKLKKINYVSLIASDVTNEALDVIAQLPNLADLNLGTTRATKEGMQKFIERRPKVEISWSPISNEDLPIMRNLMRHGAIAYAGIDGFSDADLPIMQNLMRHELMAYAGTDGFSKVTSSGKKWTHILGGKVTSNNTVMFMGLQGDWNGGDADLAQIARLSNVNMLAVYEDQIDATGWQQFAKIPQVRVLSVDKSQVTSAQLASLACASKLESLFLNTLPNPIDLSFLAKMPQLNQLNVDKTQLKASRLAPMTNLAKLEVLTLGGLDLDADDVRAILGLQTLLEFWFETGTISPDDLGRLGELPKLEKLRLRGITITDDLACLIGEGRFSSLKRLWIFADYGSPSLQLTDAAVVNITQLPSLEELWIGNSLITNEGLRLLGDCKSLRELRLRERDEITGAIEALRQARPDIEIRLD